MSDSRLRLDDLLVAEATDTLKESEQRELARLLKQHPDADRGGFSRAVAAIFLAAGGASSGEMPESLEARILEDATRAIAAQVEED